MVDELPPAGGAEWQVVGHDHEVRTSDGARVTGAAHGGIAWRAAASDAGRLLLAIQILAHGQQHALHSFPRFQRSRMVEYQPGQLPFAEFLAEIGQRPVAERDVTVGELVDYICLHRRPVAAREA